MEISVGFIGAGNMGGALIKGMVKSGLVSPDRINIYDTDKSKVESLCMETGVKPVLDNCDVIQSSHIIILAVKPNMIYGVLEQCKLLIDNNKIIVSIAAGIGIKTIKDIIGGDKKVIRTMPNTPALIGEGMTLVSPDENVSDEEIDMVIKLFQCAGKVEKLSESLMNEVIALTSSSPAYVFMLIEAMADAAVLAGIPRNIAYKLGAQAVLGSAKMVLETEKHPGELKDQVCSPAGTTIEAVAMLEEKGFRHAIIEAMNRCTRRARELGEHINEKS